MHALFLIYFCALSVITVYRKASNSTANGEEDDETREYKLRTDT